MPRRREGDLVRARPCGPRTSVEDLDGHARGGPNLPEEGGIGRERHSDNAATTLRRRVAGDAGLTQRPARVCDLKRSVAALLEQAVLLPTHRHRPSGDDAECNEVRNAGGVRVELSAVAAHAKILIRDQPLAAGKRAVK